MAQRNVRQEAVTVPQMLNKVCTFDRQHLQMLFSASRTMTLRRTSHYATTVLFDKLPVHGDIIIERYAGMGSPMGISPRVSQMRFIPI